MERSVTGSNFGTKASRGEESKVVDSQVDPERLFQLTFTAYHRQQDINY